MKRILTCVAAVVGGLAYAETNVFSGKTNLTTSAAIAALSQTDLKLSATKASLAPGEAFAVSVGAVTTSDATSLQLNAGGQDGVLTAASLAPQSGHVLVVSPGSAARQLGDAERLVVPGTAEMRRGYPTLVTRPAEPGVAPFKFLTYDAARGYVPVESSGGIWNTGDIWGNTRHLDTPIWLSAKTKINAGNFYVTSTNGVVKGETSIPLTLDSSWGPVGVSFSHPERKAGLAFTVEGGGISVENSPACIWANCAGTTWNTGYNTSWGRIVHFKGPLIGRQSGTPMTFAGWANDTREYCSFNFQSANNCVQWKGPTYVSGVRLVLNNANAAGLANAVHVLDGPTPTTRAQLMLTGSGTIGQKLCVSGYGPSDAGSVHITGVQPWTLTGGLELAGDAYLTHDNPTCGLDLSCAVTGDGRLVQGNGFVTVRNPSTHTGGTKLMAANSLVSVVTNGTLGNGETQVANGTLRFVDSEKIDQSGRIAAEAGRVEFRSPWFRSFGGLDAVTSVQNGLFEATSAGDIFFGDLEQKGTIHVTSAGDDLIVGAGGAAVRQPVAGRRQDGRNGRLLQDRPRDARALPQRHRQRSCDGSGGHAQAVHEPPGDGRRLLLAGRVGGRHRGARRQRTGDGVEGRARQRRRLLPVCFHKGNGVRADVQGRSGRRTRRRLVRGHPDELPRGQRPASGESNGPYGDASGRAADPVDLRRVWTS